MENIKLELILEKGDEGLWGRVTYNDNLITDFGQNIAEIDSKIKNLLFEFEELNPDTVVFDHVYDMYALFREFDFLNISKVAKYAGIHAGLLRQYSSGVKHPSFNQAKKIEDTIHRLADGMKKATIYVE
ncbi:hypothetical protein [Mucilaginibacter flavus]|uniref:hypothetical protein n=1 Tax=Mucilaginibacter flavus TaxID=931504 RepID=UPI0025B452ED|nr:hypothetical protein [Mucilaginibacter flavus]MDN3580300.1 hypothetical protein [Mucilaginibacter flavus]